MNKPEIESNRLRILRDRAIERLEKKVFEYSELSQSEVRKLVYELQTHQIELEIQNEELRRTQEELIEARDQFSDLYDFTPAGYVTLNHKGMILECNLTTTEMVGVVRQSLKNQFLSAFIVPDDQDVYYRHLRKVWELKQPDTCKLQMIRKDDAPLWVEIGSIIVNNNDKNEDHIRMVLIDKTSQILAELDALAAIESARATAEAANQLKSQFLANMSHEMRTPLTLIIGMSDLLEKMKLHPKQMRYLHLIKNAGNQLLNLINNILDLSKIESGSLELENIEFDIKEAVDEVVEIHKTIAANSKLSIKTLIAGNVVPVLFADRNRLQQILSNLVDNAIKYSEQTNVVVRIENDPGTSSPQSIRFTVSDKGAGIPADQRERLFEVFTQQDASTTRKYGGAGLGLSICRQLVSAMGGRIWVESVPERGTKFYFTIAPQAPDLTMKQPEPKGDLSETQGKALRILVTEDDELIRELIEEFLQPAHHKLLIAKNGKEALEKLKANDLDLILMDLQMPVMDGYTATRKIRQWEIAQDRTPVPIIALTASAMTDEVKKCVAAGCTSYLSKPISSKVLLATINKYG